MKIAYDAGHSLNTPGKRTPDGEREWSFNDKVARAFAAEISKYESVQLLRTDDSTGKTDVSLRTRTNKANAWGADIYVSIHHNANTARWGGWGGVETYVSPNASADSKRLAAAVQPRIVAAMDLRDRGVRTANLHIVRETKMPAILTEGGFMDSTTDICALRNDAKLSAQGSAIAEGVAAFGSLKRKAGTVSAAAKTTPGTFRVYTGTFADEGSAAAAVKSVEALGFKAFAKGRRVWTGTFSTLESAEAARKLIAAKVGLNPKIRDEEAK